MHYVLVQSVIGIARAIALVRHQFAMVGDLWLDKEDDLRDLGRSFTGTGDGVDLRRPEKMVEGQNQDFKKIRT
ncbi:hypothetical protein TIFTF001_030418 [Ficus carica]|uniref:Uncharacterized protein n=1 Tax=Ficus carica TaxID=3494 RepID=A0AA88J4T0_FICCA|nr:hypothetical protein TIFTF001_030353 [Ficus carica]GMN61331.1 hypothetical protein TIFTF001_030418 [Ficus carica]